MASRDVGSTPVRAILDHALMLAMAPGITISGEQGAGRSTYFQAVQAGFDGSAGEWYDLITSELQTLQQPTPLGEEMPPCAF